MIVNHFNMTWLHHSCHIVSIQDSLLPLGEIMPYSDEVCWFSWSPSFMKWKDVIQDDEVIAPCTIESGISGAISCYIKVDGELCSFWCMTREKKWLADSLKFDNMAWVKTIKKGEITDFRFHNLLHTWALWHRQARTSCDKLKDLGGWKSRNMVDRYAKFATENLAFAASSIETGKDRTVIPLSRFCHAKDANQSFKQANSLR